MQKFQIIKLFSLSLVLAFVLSACKHKKEDKKTESVESVKTVDFIPLAGILTEYAQERLALYPFEATEQGEKKYNDEMPITISTEHRNNLRTFYKKYLSKLQKVDVAALNTDEKISYDILQWNCEIELDELKFSTHLLPLNQFHSLPLAMSQWAGGTGAQPFKTVKDYENWNARMKQLVVWLDTALVNMQRGMNRGIVLPTVLAQKVLLQIEALTTFPAEKHLFWAPLNKFPKSFSSPDKKFQEMAYKMVIERDLIPSAERLAAFMRKDYIPACKESAGIFDLPYGKAYYDLQIKKYTTTNLTVNDVFELGQQEVERLLAEMEKVKNAVGYTKDLKSFFDYVRNKKELMPYTDPQQVIDNFNAIHERMKPNLANLFDLTPKTGFEVRRTEAFREASASAEYNQGSKDGTRPGIFYVPIPNVKEYNVFADEDLFLHEAIPGHHYQISLQQENELLPAFRQTLWYSAYGEGWALYCESLGKELGLYTDPYQYFGMLSAEMHRAIRLVVDVGIHVKGWTREEAIAYSLANEAEPEASIVAEIERYMAWPGQALSYKIGQLKILDLRNKAEKELGENFDIKKFHNLVLSSGCVPLAILEQMVVEWINAEKNAVQAVE